MDDDARIHYQLNQMNEAFRREENPDGSRKTVQVASNASALSTDNRNSNNHRGILKNR